MVDTKLPAGSTPGEIADIQREEMGAPRATLADLDRWQAERDELVAALADCWHALSALEYEGEDAEGLAECRSWPRPSWVREACEKASAALAKVRP